ncbi:uncharacterized protein L969DRAFT_87031 [Mixia osmundae IAM 14324]|uniref:uncharacterized protein n=1 Tax=Mixia osmundae (strain CBS 9802 / IAM 14324 / JCM 22182 / KY 12970) TaxID=764103 RepID=UPI0004A5513A|nr:uncharacterized protein L969DRAFT_87031 [Mixia osmundae IAM 14324]KEI40383.1 hypothetical protein L969DRAFT_87031 [Mixia osmundae IAM 14324]
MATVSPNARQESPVIRRGWISILLPAPTSLFGLAACRQSLNAKRRLVTRPAPPPPVASSTPEQTISEQRAIRKRIALANRAVPANFIELYQRQLKRAQARLLLQEGNAVMGLQPNARSAHLAQQRARDIAKFGDSIFYSARYSDDEYEYRHVILPKELAKYLPLDRLAEENEWRGLGIRQSPGWFHYLRHAPEPHIMLFKRQLD